jgi:hypothetical protein
LKKEILCWEITAKYFSYTHSIDTTIEILMRHHRLPKDISEKTILGSKNSRSVILNDYAKSIKKYIVFPYLSGKITE